MKLKMNDKYNVLNFYSVPRKLIRNTNKHMFILLYLALTLFPFIWALSTSFKPQSEIFALPPTYVPKGFTFENYYRILIVGEFWRYALNSIFIASTSVLISLLVSLFVGYATSRYKFIGKEFIMFFMLGGMAIGRFANVIPLYFFSTRVGLFDTYFIIILSSSALVVPLLSWLMQGYFRSIPYELDEAAKIDGCKSWDIFWKILLPSMKPAIVAGAVIATVNAWNEFILAMTLTRSPHLRVLPVAINFFKTELGVQWGELTAASIFATLPIVIFVIPLQRYFIQGLTSGTLGSS
ncbi:MAG: hypothetical protein CVV48_10590 [Spirochaetae bacterium HGW-Spirochaetae-4]|jgi:ABC-type glycerol-3-phosphate transport system permease component|nr:MAG: hypothetical protein CVV48_10590 [Spirochaetae bacterium HGW-Spirochaetae-4]